MANRLPKENVTSSLRETQEMTIPLQFYHKELNLLITSVSN